jgi:hypothetical protein
MLEAVRTMRGDRPAHERFTFDLATLPTEVKQAMLTELKEQREDSA